MKDEVEVRGNVRGCKDAALPHWKVTVAGRVWRFCTDRLLGLDGGEVA